MGCVKDFTVRCVHYIHQFFPLQALKNNPVQAWEVQIFTLVLFVWKRVVWLISILCWEGSLCALKPCGGKKKKRSTHYLMFVGNDNGSKNQANKKSDLLMRFLSFPSSSSLLTTAVGILSNRCLSSARSSCRLHSTRSQTPERERAA